MRPFYVYLLHCADGSYYIGHTDDIDQRLLQHSTGDIGYTATRKPVELRWQGEFETREGAIAFEQQIKGWSRAKKEALVAGEWERIQVLARSHSSAQGAGSLGQAQPERAGEQALSAAAEGGLRQAQPERVGGQTISAVAEGRLRQAQPERLGESERLEEPGHSLSLSVQPEPVEGSTPPLQVTATAALSAALLPSHSRSSTVLPELVEGAFQPMHNPSTVQPEPAEAVFQPVHNPLTVQPEPVEGSTPPLQAAASNTLSAALLQGNPVQQRRAMAKAITLLESTRADHRAQGDELLTQILPHTGGALRLGISGVPGVGKSTFIETLGLHLIDQGHRVAVLAIDPSSTVSGGSILGDKTRMEQLSMRQQAYIRPSPSSGTLGGVAEKTREAMLVCEAAGYDIVIVETVGVGQSETTVWGMTDMFVLLQLPNAGDELQAIKKGVMEIADLVVINKADIDQNAATRAQAQITSSLRLLGLHGSAGNERHDASFWQPKVLQISALEGVGIDGFWAAVTEFNRLQTANGRRGQRRQRQNLAWMWQRIEAGLKQAFHHDPRVQALLPQLLAEVADGRIAASTAARNMLSAHMG